MFTLVTRLLVVVSKARRREDFGCYMSNNLAAGLGPPLLLHSYTPWNSLLRPLQTFARWEGTPRAQATKFN